MARKCAVPAVLAACIAFSILMAVVRPIPHGHGYIQAVKLSLAMTLIWLISTAKPEWVFKRSVLVLVLAAGIGLGIGGFLTIDRDAEVVHVYRSVFETMDAGQNPYTSGTIFHRAEFMKPVYGNFNYPPLEIYPYYLAYRIAGTWNSTVLTATMLVLQFLVCLVFLWTFPEIKRLYLVPYLAIFLFMEFKINVSMTFLMTALILLAMRRAMERDRPGYRVLVAVLFGLGLMTKFLIIPLLGAYVWHQFDPKRWRSLAGMAADAGTAAGVAVLMMLPYGVAAVFKNTILFNLILEDRNVMTTFFPNVLSGLFTWIGHSGLYSVAAVVILAIAVGAAPKLKLFPALTAAAATFLLVAPTPKNQFLPVVFYLALTGVLIGLIGQGRLPAEVVKVRGRT